MQYCNYKKKKSIVLLTFLKWVATIGAAATDVCSTVQGLHALPISANIKSSGKDLDLFPEKYRTHW
jgi:hypothetical protein